MFCGDKFSDDMFCMGSHFSAATVDNLFAKTVHKSSTKNVL